ncbi:TPA: hypothetical protein HA238_04975 [Candidatus Micrarchaeota archaeon]|nr:hypothetical protein [Candidatus Micrarchaeota archaeon]
MAPITKARVVQEASKKELPAQLLGTKATPQFRKGIELIAERVTKAKTWVEMITRGNIESIDEFDGHVNELLRKAITHGIISPEAILPELELSGARRSNLLLVDLLIWHTFENASGMLPYGILTDPETGKFNGDYLDAFTKDHKLFWELRKLDVGPGFNLEFYKQVLLPHEEQRLLRVLRANCLDNSTLVDDKAVPIAAAIGGGLSFEKPDPGKWAEIRKNVAESVLAFWTNVADFLGHHPLVADMKDFAVQTIYPGIWEYVEYEMNRLEDRNRRTHEILEEINAEVKRGLKSRGIDAEFIIRPKSWGSAGLKMKDRTEAWIEHDLLNFGGFRSLGPCRAIIPDPRISSVQVGEGMEVTAGQTRLQLNLLQNAMRISYIESNPGAFGTTVTETFRVGWVTKRPFILREIEKSMWDIVAAKIVVKAVRKNTRERDVLKAVYDVTSEVLRPAIERILRRNGVPDFRFISQDFYVKKDRPYNSLHTDTSPQSELLVSFEYIVRTTRNDDDCEHGKAAHIIHKGARRIAEFIQGLGNRILNEVTVKQAQENKAEKLFKVNVRVIGCNSVMANCKEGETFIDAIAKVCNLAEVCTVKDKTGKSVRLSEQVNKDCELVVTLVTDQKNAMFAQGNLARALLGSCVTDEAKKQLQEIMNQGNGKKGRRR